MDHEEPKNPSSHIKSFAYDGENRTLQIKFHSGATINYFDVPASVHQGMQSCQDSVGKYFHANVRAGGFRFEKVSG